MGWGYVADATWWGWARRAPVHGGELEREAQHDHHAECHEVGFTGVPSYVLLESLGVHLFTIEHVEHGLHGLFPQFIQA